MIRQITLERLAIIKLKKICIIVKPIVCNGNTATCWYNNAYTQQSLKIDSNPIKEEEKLSAHKMPRSHIGT